MENVNKDSDRTEGSEDANENTGLLSSMTGEVQRNHQLAGSMSEELSEQKAVTVTPSTHKTTTLKGFSSASTPNSRKRKQPRSSVPEPHSEAVIKLIEATNLNPCYVKLFELFGFHSLEDFRYLNKAVLEKLEKTIRENGFIDTVDLECRSNQILYLGRKLAVDSLSKFQFSHLDSMKIIEILPKTLEENIASFNLHKIRKTIGNSIGKNASYKEEVDVHASKMKYDVNDGKEKKIIVTTDHGSEVEAIEEPRTPEDFLIRAAAALTNLAMIKVTDFFKGLTNYTGPPIAMTDIKTRIYEEKQMVKINIKCLVCHKFLAINNVDVQRFSIYNYKRHVYREHVVVESDGSKTPRLKSPKSSKQQNKIKSYFSQISFEKKEVVKSQTSNDDILEMTVIKEGYINNSNNLRDEASSEEDEFQYEDVVVRSDLTEKELLTSLKTANKVEVAEMEN